MNRYSATFRFGPPGSPTHSVTFRSYGTHRYLRYQAWDAWERSVNSNNKMCVRSNIVLVSVEEVQ